MIKNECKIVKDLLPNYVENLTSKETKEFVEEHIETCKDCKEILKMLKGERNKENQEQKNEEEQEFKHLKKYNRKMRILKITASILALIILVMWGIMIIMHIKRQIAYEKGKYPYEIITQAENKLEELIKESNLEIIEERKFRYKDGENRSRNIYKYKDNKISEEYRRYIKDSESTSLEYKNYGIASEKGTEMIQITENISFEETDNMFYYISSDIRYTDSRKDSYIDPFNRFDVLDCSSLKVREEKYKDKDCYVISLEEDEVHDEIWIEKETYIILRKIISTGDDYYDESDFTWNIGIVTDEGIFDRTYNRRSTK